MFVSPAVGSSIASIFSSPMIPMLLIFFGFWYFFIIRPQVKRNKSDQAMRSALSKGDEVMVLGGLIGRIAKTDEQFISIEVAKGVTIQLQRTSVNAKLPEGTYKASSSQ